MDDSDSSGVRFHTAAPLRGRRIQLPSAIPATVPWKDNRSTKHWPQIFKKTIKNRPQVHKTFAKNASKIYQKSTPNLSRRPSWRGLGGSWGALGGLLGVSWGYLGPKSQQVTEKLVRWTPLDPPTWSQNPTKINIKSIKKLMIFWCYFLIDFWLILGGSWGPTWGQHAPKIHQKINQKTDRNLHQF